jgi:ABC-type antimicrobial peptide transport system permease subunit
MQAVKSFLDLCATLLAVTALLLASVGIFGVISYQLAQRSSEFGVRMALEASRLQITNLVLSRGAIIAVAGCFCGLALSAFASRLLLTSAIFRHRIVNPRRRHGERHQPFKHREQDAG